MKLSLRQWLLLKIAVGAGAVLYGFGSKLIVYLSGLRDQGGGWADIDDITVALFALVAVGDGLLALGALLATFIPDVPPDKPSPAPEGVVTPATHPERYTTHPDVDLSDPKPKPLVIDALDLINPAD